MEEWEIRMYWMITILDPLKCMSNYRLVDWSTNRLLDDLQVDLKIRLHNSYTMKNIKLLSYSLSEREVSFIDKPSHGYNRKS